MAKVGVAESDATSGSCVYPGTGLPPITPAVYCARTEFSGIVSGVNQRTDFNTFTFSSRTAFAAIVGGGSIAVSVRSCSRWF